MSEDPTQGAVAPSLERPREWLGHDRNFLKLVARTGAFNIGSSLVAALMGVVLARVLSPGPRGDYAAVMTAFGITLVVFELGLSTSIVYFVAKDPGALRAIVRSTAKLLAALAVPGALCLLLLSRTPVLSEGSRPLGALIMAVTVLFSFLSAPPVFALQATDLTRWNVVRLLQPALALVAVVGLALTHRLTFVTGVLAVAVTIALQSIVAWWWFARDRRHQEPRTVHGMAPPRGQLVRYGSLNVLASAPGSLNARVDQLYLAAIVPSSQLGLYAVAVSLSVLTQPLVAAFGNVAFPRIASGNDRRKTARSSLIGTLAISSVGAAILIGGAFLLLGPVFGKEYAAAFPLVVALAPGAVFLMVNQVLSDVLRGYDRSGAVAVGQWAGLVVTVGGLAISVPRWGAMGAALTSTVAYALVAGLLIRALRLAHKEADVVMGELG